MQNTLKKYAGTWTALITPFTSDGKIDEEALKRLVRRQIDAGITGIVPVGTTGESPTIHDEEAEKIFRICVEEGRGKIMIMAGTGSNSTEHAINNTKRAKAAGADACLVVCPYYNKPTQEGLRRHFLAIAEVGLPIIIYNIKGRTGINMETSTLMDLAKHEMIVGVKEASGDLNQISEVINKRSQDFTVLSGDDGLTYEVVKMGGDGVISVASNVIPEKIVKMVNFGLDGNEIEDEKMSNSLSDIFKKIFIETNPIPIKYLAHKMNLCELLYRLPMIEPSPSTMKILDEVFFHYQLK